MLCSFSRPLAWMAIRNIFGVCLIVCFFRTPTCGSARKKAHPQGVSFMYSIITSYIYIINLPLGKVVMVMMDMVENRHSSGCWRQI